MFVIVTRDILLQSVLVFWSCCILFYYWISSTWSSYVWDLQYFEDVFEHVLVILWALCCLCCYAKANYNVLLTDASSYLLRAVVGFKLRGHGICDPPLEHMLPALWPSTMTERRPVCLGSSLMAHEVKGHGWATVDFPQLYTSARPCDK